MSTPKKRIKEKTAVKKTNSRPAKPVAAAPTGTKAQLHLEANTRNPVPDQWNLRLYVAGQSPKSAVAITNLRRFCEENLAGRYTIEVIDLLENPALARGDQIVAIPTLVRKLPAPIRKIIGDLSNRDRVFVGLDIRSA